MDITFHQETAHSSTCLEGTQNKLLPEQWVRGSWLVISGTLSLWRNWCAWVKKVLIRSCAMIIKPTKNSDSLSENEKSWTESNLWPFALGLDADQGLLELVYVDKFSDVGDVVRVRSVVVVGRHRVVVDVGIGLRFRRRCSGDRRFFVRRIFVENGVGRGMLQEPVLGLSVEGPS